MNFLEEKILNEGVIKEGNILKIDNFLHHQIDIDVMRQITYDLKRRFRGIPVNKILTIKFRENQ
jgi:xanthine phosphoribosyltransferase